MKKIYLIPSLILLVSLFAIAPAHAQKGLESSFFFTSSGDKVYAERAIAAAESGNLLPTRDSIDPPNNVYGFTANIANSTDDIDFNPKVVLNSFFKINDRNFLSIDLSFLEDDSDTLLSDNSTKVFMPELSSSSINFWYTNTRFSSTSFNALLSFGTKKFSSTEDGLEDIESGVATIRVSLEHSLIEKNLSVYGGMNYNRAVTSVNEFNNYFELDKDKEFWAPFAGFKFIIQNGAFKGSSADFSFLFVTKSVENIYKTNDLLFPLFKIGMTKPL